MNAENAGRPSGQVPDFLIRARHVVPVVPAGTVLDDHCVAISGREIMSVLPASEALVHWPGVAVKHLSDHVLLPGFVNAHTHAPMSLLRGYADDMELHVWLQEHIWPAEKKFVGSEFVADGTRLAVAEMIRGGTTCFNDMYFFPDATVDVCRETGIRASVGITVIEMQSAWAAGVERYIEKGLQLMESVPGDSTMSFTLSPHAPYTVSDQTLERISDLSESLSLPVHMHLLETEWEVKHSLQQHDVHPLARLEQAGLLNDRLQAVHMTQVSAADIERLFEAGSHVIHCPQSNLKLASGMCPLTLFLKAGVNVALGSDGAASNNDLDMLGEAQTAALLAKGIAGDARAVDAGTVLEMLTINGARALGLQDRVGSIEAGKQADLVALNLDDPSTQPLYNVVSQLVYAASRHQVSDVWVAGKQLLADYELTTLDRDEVIASAREWQSRLAGLRNAGRHSH